MTRFTLALSVVLVVFACGPSASTAPDVPTAGIAPLRCVILQDVSGSAKGIPRLTMDDLDRLIARVLAGGGELAFSTVGAGAPPLVRLPLAPPAPLSLAVTERNVFRAVRQRAALVELEKESARARAAYRAAAEPAVDAFRDAVQPLLGGRARVTDLVAGLERALLFVQEPARYPDAVRVVLVISDGLDTGRHEGYALLFDAGVQVVMVNDGRELGMLEAWRDRIAVFESPAAAVSFVLSLGGP